MIRRILAVVVTTLILANPARADVSSRALSRALANALYCQLSGCTMTGPILAPDGTAAAPSYSFSSETTMGMYRAGSGQLGFSQSGTLSQIFTPTGIYANSFVATKTTQDAMLTRRAAGNWQLGAADAAAPVAQTLTAQGVVAGTSNTAGTDLTIEGSRSTGSAAGGSIILKVSPPGGAGSAQNTMTTALTVSGTTGNVTFANGFKLAKTFSATYDPASLAAATQRADSVTVTGIVTGTSVSASPGVAPAARCVIASVRATGADTVEVVWQNADYGVGGVACDTASSTWTFTQAQ